MRQAPWVRAAAALLLALLASAALASTAAAFAFAEFIAGPPPPESAPRWGWNQGLADGLTVAVEVGFATDLGAASQAEIDLVLQAVRDAFAAWESPVLHFEVLVEQGGVSQGPSVGFEVDLFAVPDTHPFFVGNAFFGAADLDAFNGQNLMTNGQLSTGYTIHGADIFVNQDAVQNLASAFGFSQQEQLDALRRLIAHEFGHVLGLGHPNDNNPIDPSLNWDTDNDPLNAMFIDPADPFGDLIPFAPNRDNEAVMSNRPCGEPFVAPCPALFFTSLRNDDIGGRDVLYPIPRQSVLPGDVVATHADPTERTVLRVDPVTGNRVRVSCTGTSLWCSVGTGPVLPQLRAIVAPPGGDILLVAEQEGSEDVVLRVDPVSGNRSVASSSSVGGGLSPMSLSDLAVEPTGDLVVAHADPAEKAVLRIDLATGDRTRVSCSSGGMGCAVGTGPPLAQMRAIEVDSGSDILLVHEEAGEDVVLRVDSISGDRTVASSATVGSGLSPMSLSDLALEPTGDLVVTHTDATERAVLRVDLATGDRTRVSCSSGGVGCAVGTGPPLTQMRAIAVEPDGGILLAHEGAGEDVVLRVDPLSGDRTIVASSSVGAGLTPMFLSDLAPVPSRQDVTVPAGAPAMTNVLGSSALPGGVDAQFAGTTGGTFSAEFFHPPLAEAQMLLASPGSVDFVIPSDPYQFWELSYSGGFSGLVQLTFGYDDTHLHPADEASLVVEQYKGGMWVTLPVLARDTVANTITVETDSTSPFILAVPTLPAAGWLFSGVAAGGNIEFTIGAVLITVAIGNGDSASDVAAAVAIAINANGALAAAGITATANGARVDTNGPVTSTDLHDAGLDFALLFAELVPALGLPGRMAALAMLAIAGIALARARRSL